jgi:hypothetical protein
MTDAGGVPGSERSSRHIRSRRQPSVAAAGQQHEVDRPIPGRVAAAMKPIKTGAQETS